MTRRFELSFESVAALEREVDENLRKGRTFVSGQVAAADRSPCVVCVRHPASGAEIELNGEVVFAQTEGTNVGVGVDLLDGDLCQRLDELMALGQDVLELELGESEARRSSNSPDSRRGITVHEKVRKLSPPAREKLARTGALAERVALERAFGASVWEALLENAQMTGAEIAKIAKNGMAPATTLAHIAGHAGWLAKPEVRRALLSNPRLPSAQAERVLRSLPAPELRLVPSQAAYPAGIRALARRLLQK